VIGLIIAVIIGILLIGLVLKLLKLAIVIVLSFGAVMLDKKYFGKNGNGKRIR
jgi:hypothetical protein